MRTKAPLAPPSNLQHMIRRAVLLALAPTAACSAAHSPIFRSDAGGFRDASVLNADGGARGEPLLPRDAATPRDASRSTRARDSGMGHVPRNAGCTARFLSGDGKNGGAVLWPCGAPPIPNDGRSSFDACADRCLGSHLFNSCFEDPSADAGTTATTIICRIDHTGRRPAGLLDQAAGTAAATIGDVLARAAFLEAASVDAFASLAVELARHAAPQPMLRRLHAAAADEVRHADAVAAFARRFSATPPPVHVIAPAARDLLEIAVDNAREGCVRETYGVASALAQAMRATDPELRALMAMIASDELRHAELSWDLASWLDTQLDAESRAHVAEAQRQAVGELASDLEFALPEAVRLLLGIASPAEGRRVTATLRRDLWMQA